VWLPLTYLSTEGMLHGVDSSDVIVQTRGGNMEWVLLATTGRRSLGLKYSALSGETIIKSVCLNCKYSKQSYTVKYCSATKEIPTKPAMS